eukprot:Gb_35927 [translate_table: standard]
MATTSCPPNGFNSKYYLSSPNGQCIRQSSYFEGKAVLNQGVGYSVILGFGAFFAVFTSFLVCSIVEEHVCRGILKTMRFMHGIELCSLVEVMHAEKLPLNFVRKSSIMPSKFLFTDTFKYSAKLIIATGTLVSKELSSLCCFACNNGVRELSTLLICKVVLRDDIAALKGRN